MDFFTKMNKYLEEGWKLTNASCTDCKSSIMFSTEKNIFWCIQCSKEDKTLTKPEKPDLDEIEKELEREFDRDKKMYEKLKKTENKKQDEVSHKLSEYLLSGWTMLEECCQDCLVPLMKKQTKKICVGCNIDFGENKEKRDENKGKKEENFEKIEESKEKIYEKTKEKKQENNDKKDKSEKNKKNKDKKEKEEKKEKNIKEKELNHSVKFFLSIYRN